jgi:hypothetical protein
MYPYRSIIYIYANPILPTLSYLIQTTTSKSDLEDAIKLYTKENEKLYDIQNRWKRRDLERKEDEKLLNELNAFAGMDDDDDVKPMSRHDRLLAQLNEIYAEEKEKDEREKYEKNRDKSQDVILPKAKARWQPNMSVDSDFGRFVDSQNLVRKDNEDGGRWNTRHEESSTSDLKHDYREKRKGVVAQDGKCIFE